MSFLNKRLLFNHKNILSDRDPPKDVTKEQLAFHTLKADSLQYRGQTLYDIPFYLRVIVVDGRRVSLLDLKLTE